MKTETAECWYPTIDLSPPSKNFYEKTNFLNIPFSFSTLIYPRYKVSNRQGCCGGGAGTAAVGDVGVRAAAFCSVLADIAVS